MWQVEGIDLVTLAAMLGHSKIKTVMRYAHPTQDHPTNAMAKLELYKRFGTDSGVCAATEHALVRIEMGQSAGSPHKNPHSAILVLRFNG
jgi:hypothetical protein